MAGADRCMRISPLLAAINAKVRLPASVDEMNVGILASVCCAAAATTLKVKKTKGCRC